MLFDIDGTALDAVQLAQYEADMTGKPYAVVSAPSGSLLAVPVDQCALEMLEVIQPLNGDNNG